MTIQAIYTPERYTITASQLAFPITFPFVDDDHIRVVVTDAVTEVDTDLDGAGVDFHVDGDDVVTEEQQPDGDKLTVWMEMPNTQLSNYKNAGELDLEVVEDDFDEATLNVQTLTEQLYRCAKVPVSSSAEGEVIDEDLANTVAASALEASDSAEAAAATVVYNYLNARAEGIVPNGVIDNTSDLQALLDTGRDLYLPEVDDPSIDRYKVSVALQLQVGQRIFGARYGSPIEQVTPLLNVIEGEDLVNSSINDVRLICEGTKNAYNNGCGVYINGGDNIRIKDVLVKNMKGHGILCEDVINSFVETNLFKNSTTVDDDTNGLSGSDIRFQGVSTNNNITGNICMSGNFGGIRLYTITSGDDCSRNKIIGNTVLNAKGYGIFLYRSEQSSAQNEILYRNIVTNNIIDNITGTIKNSGGGDYDFGTGIYIQGAEFTLIEGNQVTNTHSGAVAHTEDLGPGAIAAVNMSSVAIIGNEIGSAGINGLYIKDVNNFGLSDGTIMIANNPVVDTALDAIYVRGLDNVSILDNPIEDSNSEHINIANTSPQKNYNIRLSTCRNSSSRGVDINYVDGCKLSGGIVDLSSAAGVRLGYVTDATVSGVSILNGSSDGLHIDTGCEDVFVDGNLITGNLRGYRGTANARLGNNRIYGNTTDWYTVAAPYGKIRTLDDEATPTVLDGEDFLTGGTTTITDFTNESLGQELHIRADHSITILGVAMASGDTISFKMFEDGVWTKTGSVIA
jgi:hypothetical protein